jgi:hypothetical protein
MVGRTTQRVAAYPITVHLVSATLRPKVKGYSLTTFECIFREFTLGIAVKLEAVESPAVGDTR